MWANFISHCYEGAIFHNSQSELFHIRRKPNISLKAYDSEVFRNFVDAFRAFSVCRQIRTGETLEIFTNLWYNKEKSKEITTITPKEQCEVLLDKLLPFAEDQMKKHREFYPFAAVMLMDDSVELTGSYDGNEHPESKDVLADLIQIHKQLAAEGKIKASGIVWNAGIASADGKPTDAIIVSLEHKNDYSVIVGEPYKIGFFKKITFGNLFAMEGKHDIF